MIKSFKNKGLKELFLKGDSAKVNQDHHQKLLDQMDALDAATEPQQMNVSGWNYHSLKGKPKRYSVHVNGNWCLTFEWDGENAIRVDYEDYH